MRQVEPNVLDISPLDAIDRYPAILRHFDRIAVGERIWIVTDREPGLFRRRLRLDRPGAFAWECDRRDEHFWTVAIVKTRQTPDAADEQDGYWARMTHPALDRPPSRAEWDDARLRTPPCTRLRGDL